MSEPLAPFPDSLNKYLAAKIVLAIRTARKVFGTTPQAYVAPELPMAHAQAAFKETISWPNPLRGAIRQTDKEQADTLAIGGSRNTAEPGSRLSYLSKYGMELGAKLKLVLDSNPKWVNAT